MKPHSLQHLAQADTEGTGMGVIVPFPIANKYRANTALSGSDSIDTAYTDEQQRRMEQARDALRLIVKELEAVQREVAGGGALR
ncbi:hypothetical protein [Pararhizobium sp. LjRoot238]|uniref:hypothetical protein n=1 Tax=Pararhizobium sp. LjRoot238 TaxID=3342293 RepID=UPI003ECE1BAD